MYKNIISWVVSYITEETAAFIFNVNVNSASMESTGHSKTSVNDQWGYTEVQPTRQQSKLSAPWKHQTSYHGDFPLGIEWTWQIHFVFSQMYRSIEILTTYIHNNTVFVWSFLVHFACPSLNGKYARKADQFIKYLWISKEINQFTSSHSTKDSVSLSFHLRLGSTHLLSFKFLNFHSVRIFSQLICRLHVLPNLFSLIWSQ
jgi:hypothetical protein